MVYQYLSYAEDNKIVQGTISASTSEIAGQAGTQDYPSKARVHSDLPGRHILFAIEQHQILAELEQKTRKLESSEAHLRNIIKSNADGIVIVDRNGIVLFYNPAAESLFDRKAGSLLGRQFGYPIVAGETPEIDIIRRGRETGVAEMRVVEIEWEGETAYLASLRDVTERKQLHEKRIPANRLAAVGELAAGVAHELNNPLTGVIGFSALLLEKDVPDDIREDIEIIHHEAQRAAEVVRNLLTFARKHTPSKQLVNINGIIKKVLKLRAYAQRISNIQVNTQFAPDLPKVMADYFQLQQGFLNIIINAEYFMIEAHNKGTLTITTEKVGDIIRASFTDDGPGIPQENLGHLFDTFFTTKEVGKGTGLGLSICHGTITEHSGSIYAESELGKGAVFTIELPISIDMEGTVK